MEMNTPESESGRDRGDEGARSVAAAATALRDLTDHRWVEVADTMLAKVLRRQRTSHAVGARNRTGAYHVSENVLRMSLQRAIDPVPHCELVDIRFDLARDVYLGVLLIVRVQYPLPIIALADQIREQACAGLTRILGAVQPPVTVSAMHVHVDDVTVGDPKTAD